MQEPTIVIDDQVLTVSGRLVRIGRLKQELYREIRHPESFTRRLKESRAPIDVLTFLNVFPQRDEVLHYKCEWDNFAVIEVSSLEAWLGDLPRGTRRALKKGQAAGIEVRTTALDDALVRQIMEIFDETPIRQGRPFWHYRKTFDEAREMLSRDAAESTFLCAYLGDELIGFVKLIRASQFARMALFLGKNAHRDKGVNNVLIAQSVAFCAERRVPYLVYGQLDYGKVWSTSLAEFKLNNGFKKMAIARYYAPLTARGSLALRLNLHHGPKGMLPARVVRAALALRGQWYAWRLKPSEVPRTA